MSRVRIPAEVLRVLDLEGLSLEDLQRADRHPGMMAVRREFAHKLREEGWSLNEIGRVMRRDHSTVMNLLRPKATRSLWA